MQQQQQAQQQQSQQQQQQTTYSSPTTLATSSTYSNAQISSQVYTGSNPSSPGMEYSTLPPNKRAKMTPYAYSSSNNTGSFPSTSATTNASPSYSTYPTGANPTNYTTNPATTNYSAQSTAISSDTNTSSSSLHSQRPAYGTSSIAT